MPTTVVITAYDPAWAWPAGVTSLTAEAIGAGGAGGNATNTTSTGGGGKGGSYAKKVITKGAESTLDIYIGIGGGQGTSAGTGGEATIITQGGTVVLSAAGGAGVAANTLTGASALVGSNIGDTTFAGGNGGTGVSGGTSGAGGGAAGPSSAGGNASGGTAGTKGTGNFLDGTQYQGDGAAGVAVRNPGIGGPLYGGGGSGGSTNQTTDRLGGTGGDGIVVLTYTITHATTGALTGPGSAVAGSAARSAPSGNHDTSGALTGPGAATSGSAARMRAFGTSGALAGAGAAVAGSSARTRVHETTAVLAGGGATVAGDSSSATTRSASGALTGAGASVAGSAQRTGAVVTHSTSGDLAGAGSSVAGAAVLNRLHGTSGVLTGAAAVIASVARRYRAHPASGALAGGGSAVAGAASRADEEVLLLTDYGAVGDGTTNNRTAFQNAFAASASTGKWVLVPEGVFAFSGDVLVMDGAKMRGLGVGSVIHALDYTVASIFFRGEGTQLQNVKLTTAGTFTRQTPYEMTKIAILGANNWVIDRVFVDGAPAAGIQTGESATNGVIRNCTIHGTKSDSIHVSDASSYIEIHNNAIWGSGDDGIAVVSYHETAFACHHITAHHNLVEDNVNGRNMSVVGGSDIHYYQNLIDGNEAERAGIYVAAENNASYTTYPCLRVLIERNTVHNTGSVGDHSAVMIYSDGLYTNNDLDFVRNHVTFTGTAKQGFRLFGPQTNILLDQNKLTNSSADYQGTSDPDVTLNLYSSGPYGHSEGVGPLGTEHDVSGALAGAGSTVAGSAMRQPAGVTVHSTTGALPVSGGQAVVQGSAARTINPTKTASVQDHYDQASLDTAKWSVVTLGAATGGVTVSGGRLRLNLTTNTLGAGYLCRTVDTKDFAGSYVFTRLVNGMIVSNNQDGAQTDFGVLADADSGYMWQQRSNGTLIPHWKVAGTPADGPTFVYTPTTHAWLRIKEEGGTVYWQHAPASASDPPQEHQWVTDHTRTRAADGSFAINAVRVRYSVLMSFGTPGVPTGAVQFDCVNTRTVATITHACTGALTGPGHSLTGQAARRVSHAASGVLPGKTSLLTGAARRSFEHTATGALPGGSAIITADGSASDVTRKLWVDAQDTAGAWSDTPQTADPWTDVPPESGSSWGS